MRWGVGVLSNCCLVDGGYRAMEEDRTVMLSLPLRYRSYIACELLLTSPALPDATGPKADVTISAICDIQPLQTTLSNSILFGSASLMAFIPGPFDPAQPPQYSAWTAQQIFSVPV